MAKTVITAPHKTGGRPAPKPAPAPAPQTEPAQPPIAERSVAPEEAPAQAALDELLAIEQRLSDGLAGVQEKQAEHRAALDTIAEGLAALPGRIADAEARLAALQQEQALLPRRINSARALLIGASGTKAEGQAQAELDTLQARQGTLPHDLEQAEATERETRRACEQERAQLEQAEPEHQAALADLAGLAEALREQADAQRRAIGQAKLEALHAERQEKAAALEQAEVQAAEARAALAAQDTAAQDALAVWPDLKLGYQQAYIPVADGVTRRLEAGIAYRKELLAWYHEGASDWALGMDEEWFRPDEAEWSSLPQQMKRIIGEMERALAKHTEKEQQRLR